MNTLKETKLDTGTKKSEWPLREKIALGLIITIVIYLFIVQ
jgi:hypothetical protein